MDMLSNLRAFVTVARVGSFSEAARQLHVVPSVIAKRIAQLERTMTARLFDRTTRSVVMTEAGHRLRARADSLIELFDGVVHDVRQDDERLSGHIKLLAPTALMQVRLVPLLDDFLERHPGVTLETALVDRSINPLEEDDDMAISGRTAQFPNVEAVPLARVSPRLCAAPSDLDARGTPTHPRELVAHDGLVFRPAGRTWSLRRGRQTLQIEMYARLVAQDNRMLLHSALQGRGIAQLPHYICKDALAFGELVEVLPDFRPVDSWFKAYVPQTKLGTARIQALLACIQAGLRDTEGTSASTASASASAHATAAQPHATSSTSSRKLATSSTAAD